MDYSYDFDMYVLGELFKFNTQEQHQEKEDEENK